MKCQSVKEGRRARELVTLRGWRSPDDRAVAKHIREPEVQEVVTRGENQAFETSQFV